VAQLLKFPLENSESCVIVEVQEVEQRGGLVKASRSDTEVRLADHSLEDVIRQSLPLIQAMNQVMISMTLPAVVVEFGVSINENCEITLVANPDKANFRISLRSIS